MPYNKSDSWESYLIKIMPLLTCKQKKIIIIMALQITYYFSILIIIILFDTYIRSAFGRSLFVPYKKLKASSAKCAEQILAPIGTNSAFSSSISNQSNFAFSFFGNLLKNKCVTLYYIICLILIIQYNFHIC